MSRYGIIYEIETIGEIRKAVSDTYMCDLMRN